MFQNKIWCFNSIRILQYKIKNPSKNKVITINFFKTIKLNKKIVQNMTYVMIKTSLSSTNRPQ